MENAESILVVILASFLAVFLLLSIILIVKCIQIADSVKRVSEKAERVVERAESVGEFIATAGNGLALGRIISSVVDTLLRRDKKQSKKGKA